MASPRERTLARALGGQYRVVRLLGRGGFADVYEVRDENLHRRLAVKVLRDDLPWSAATLARFKQEARAVARLSHPNTLPIHFVGEAEGLVFYAMPYCEGRTLADVLQSDGALPVSRALAIAEPILDTLQHAHEHGLVHRDVKPDNILIDDATGRPLLVDFGIAKDLDDLAGHTQTGFIVGTPMYMSPEQAVGHHAVDARADIYAMGVVLFQMVSGVPPFEGADSQQIVSRHLHQPVPLATLSSDRVPPWLAAIIVRCLAKHPDDRYPSARAVLDAIRAGRAASAAGKIASSRTSEDETSTIEIPRPRRRTGRRPMLAGLGLVAAVGVLWASSRPRTTLLVHNRLTEAVVLTLGDSGITVGAGDSVTVPVRAGQKLDAGWRMVRPVGATGQARGMTMEGSITVAASRGGVREVIDAARDGRRRFAPLVVNESRRPVRASVVGGRDTNFCDCSIPPGDSLRLGYYALEPGSVVRVHAGAHAAARFEVDAQRIDSATGAVVFRVRDASLKSPSLPASIRPAPQARVRQRPAAPSNPLGTFLPVR